jgi:hypothetical protein
MKTSRRAPRRDANLFLLHYKETGSSSWVQVNTAVLCSYLLLLADCFQERVVDSVLRSNFVSPGRLAKSRMLTWRPKLCWTRLSERWNWSAIEQHIMSVSLSLVSFEVENGFYSTMVGVPRPKLNFEAYLRPWWLIVNGSEKRRRNMALLSRWRSMRKASGSEREVPFRHEPTNKIDLVYDGSRSRPHSTLLQAATNTKLPTCYRDPLSRAIERRGTSCSREIAVDSSSDEGVQTVAGSAANSVVAFWRISRGDWFGHLVSAKWWQPLHESTYTHVNRCRKLVARQLSRYRHMWLYTSL